MGDAHLTQHGAAGDKRVLITGCSSGIGESTAAHLADDGWQVFATARDLDSIGHLAELGCELLQLDVTDEQSMRSAVKTAESQGPLRALVNNAGYAEYGPVEELDMEAIRRQFETNVFGLVRMCQLVLPGMRAQQRGTIVNISSMGGKLTFPAGGAYHASKHAVEAFSDALRYEVRPFGVRVVLVEPGIIKTRYAETGARTLEEQTPEDSPYAAFAERAKRVILRFYDTPAATDPETVADVIAGILSASNPRSRYRVTMGARALLMSRKILPDMLWDAALRPVFSTPQPEEDER